MARSLLLLRKAHAGAIALGMGLLACGGSGGGSSSGQPTGGIYQIASGEPVGISSNYNNPKISSATSGTSALGWVTEDSSNGTYRRSYNVSVNSNGSWTKPTVLADTALKYGLASGKGGRVLAIWQGWDDAKMLNCFSRQYRDGNWEATSTRLTPPDRLESDMSAGDSKTPIALLYGTDGGAAIWVGGQLSGSGTVQNERMYFRRLSNGVWSAPLVLDTTTYPDNTLGRPYAVVGESGKVLVSWMKFPGPGSQSPLEFKTAILEVNKEPMVSTVQGATLGSYWVIPYLDPQETPFIGFIARPSAPSVIRFANGAWSSPSLLGAMPSLASDGFLLCTDPGGQTVAIWAEPSSTAGKNRISFTRFTGTVWSPPQVLAAGPYNQNGNATLLFAHKRGNGQLDIAWQHYTNYTDYPSIVPQLQFMPWGASGPGTPQPVLTGSSVLTIGIGSTSNNESLLMWSRNRDAFSDEILSTTIH